MEFPGIPILTPQSRSIAAGSHPLSSCDVGDSAGAIDCMVTAAWLGAYATVSGRHVAASRERTLALGETSGFVGSISIVTWASPSSASTPRPPSAAFAQAERSTSLRCE